MPTYGAMGTRQHPSAGGIDGQLSHNKTDGKVLAHSADNVPWEKRVTKVERSWRSSGLPSNSEFGWVWSIEVR